VYAPRLLIYLILHSKHGVDGKLAANWIMGDIAAYLNVDNLSIDETN
jgi:Asp-tRNA(Asn)/Glu-tRNA(Gln) amidotransferase B subunit